MYAYHNNIFEVSVIEITLIIFFCVLLLLLIGLVRYILLHKIIVYLHCVRIYHCKTILSKKSILLLMDFWIVSSFEFFLFVFPGTRVYPVTPGNSGKVSVEEIQVEVLNHTLCVSLTSLCNAKVLSKVVLTIYFSTAMLRKDSSF